MKKTKIYRKCAGLCCYWCNSRLHLCSNEYKSRIWQHEHQCKEAHRSWWTITLCHVNDVNIEFCLGFHLKEHINMPQELTLKSQMSNYNFFNERNTQISNHCIHNLILAHIKKLLFYDCHQCWVNQWTKLLLKIDYINYKILVWKLTLSVLIEWRQKVFFSSSFEWKWKCIALIVAAS